MSGPTQTQSPIIENFLVTVLPCSTAYGTEGGQRKYLSQIMKMQKKRN